MCGSNTAFSLGAKFLSDRYKNLSIKTTLSTKGASISLREPNITTRSQFAKNLTIRGLSNSSDDEGRLSKARTSVADMQYLKNTSNEASFTISY